MNVSIDLPGGCHCLWSRVLLALLVNRSKMCINVLLVLLEVLWSSLEGKIMQGVVADKLLAVRWYTCLRKICVCKYVFACIFCARGNKGHRHLALKRLSCEAFSFSSSPPPRVYTNIHSHCGKSVSKSSMAGNLPFSCPLSLSYIPKGMPEILSEFL